MEESLSSSRNHAGRVRDRRWRLFKRVGLIVGILLAAFVIVLVRMQIQQNRRIRGHEMMRTISNAKQLYLGLMEFEADHGYFPDDASAARDPKLNRFRGNFSNDYLGQLVAGDYLRDETFFYAKDVRYAHRPDDVMEPVTRILEKNECGFSYVMVEENGKRRGLSTADDARLPILAAPLVNERGVCEPTSYDGRGIYLRIDGSVRRERLRSSDQKIPIAGGMTLFDQGPGGIWGDLKPVVLLPER